MADPLSLLDVMTVEYQFTRLGLREHAIGG
jgi:hypothetical protein